MAGAASEAMKYDEARSLCCASLPSFAVLG